MFGAASKLGKSVVFGLCFFNFSCSEESQKFESGSVSSEAKILNREVDKGRHIFEDGSIYEGELVRGRPNG